MQITIDVHSFESRQDVIVEALSHMTSQSVSTTAGNALIRDGQRAANDVLLYDIDAFPRRFIAPCSMIWSISEPTSATTAATSNNNNDDDNDNNDCVDIDRGNAAQLFMFVHVSAYDDVLRALQTLAASREQLHVSAQRGELLRFELRGPHSGCVLLVVKLF
jgi:hypothetical protein